MLKKKKSEDQLAPWIISYGDMVTLLMTFFVLLYSFSLVDLRKFRAMSSSMAQQFGNSGAISGGDGVLDGSKGTSLINLDATSASRQVQEMGAKVDKYLKESGLQEVATAVRQERGVVIRFEDQVFFDSGSAGLRPAAIPVAAKVAELVRSMPNHVRVEGHADNVPIHNGSFASNWELSTARATRFLKYLIDAGGVNPMRISAAGYGEYRPVAENNTEDGRQKNRRVDVVLLRTDLSEAEPHSADGATDMEVTSDGR